MTRVRTIAFDLDDTLAVSKSQVDRRMAKLLCRLIDVIDVCIISGGRFEQFERQVLRHLPADSQSLASLHLMPTCGTRYYRWDNGAWQQVYAEDLSEYDKRRIRTVLEQGAKELDVWETRTWGERIEDRGSQITYSALGQEAPAANKYQWDPGNSKKESLREFAATRLPDLEVRVGGSTSVDVTRRGIDKAYGIRKLMQYLGLNASDILFVGDRLSEGGNDYPVRAVGVRCLEVSRWEETADFIESFLASHRAEESKRVDLQPPPVDADNS